MEVYELLVILMFVAFVGLIFTGYPIAWIMGGVALWFAAIGVLLASLDVDTFLLKNYASFTIIVDRIWAVMSNWVLVALPNFVFMGLMLDRSGVAENLMTNFVKVFGRLRAGMAITVVVIGLLLAASTGILGASVVLLCTLAFPIMLERGYSKELGAGVIAGAGTLGLLIPPSISCSWPTTVALGRRSLHGRRYLDDRMDVYRLYRRAGLHAPGDDAGAASGAAADAAQISPESGSPSCRRRGDPRSTRIDLCRRRNADRGVRTRHIDHVAACCGTARTRVGDWYLGNPRRCAEDRPGVPRTPLRARAKRYAGRCITPRTETTFCFSALSQAGQLRRMVLLRTLRRRRAGLPRFSGAAWCAGPAVPTFRSRSTATASNRCST